MNRKCQVKLVSWLFCTTWFDRCDLSPSEMEEFKAFVRELLVGQIPFILKLHGARSIQPKFQPVRQGKVVHLKRKTRFFETFPVGPNRSIEFWTEISGNFG